MSASAKHLLASHATNRGPVAVPSVKAWKTNADLIVDVAQLGYIKGNVLDATYGLGNFWTRYRPKNLTGCDIDPAKSPLGLAVDFTHLPWPDKTFDTVVFDPPYRMCLDFETRILTKRGWLSWDEVSIGDEAYSMDHETGLGCWDIVDAVNVYGNEPTSVMVSEGRNINFVATPEHRWPVLSGKGFRRWKTTSTLTASDRVIHAATWGDTPTFPTLSDDMVQLIAWYWTEGSQFRKRSTYGVFCQSPTVNPANCARIESCLTRLYGPPVQAFPRTGRTSEPMWRMRDERPDIRRYYVSAAVGSEIAHHAPGLAPSVEFLTSLTDSQRKLFIEISYAADGRNGQNQDALSQQNEEMAESFRLACILDGRPTSATYDDHNRFTVSMRQTNHTRPARSGLQTEVRDIGVWCPTTRRTGTWLARRRNCIYFTGNSGTPDRSMDEAYGTSTYTRWQDRLQLILDGATECGRVTSVGGHLLVKCQDQVVSGSMCWQTDEVRDALLPIGFRKKDRFDMVTKPRSQPKGRRQVHSRSNRSTLLVFVRER